MKMPKLHSLVALALLTFPGPLLAHHGTSGSYDENKVVTIKGIVKEFRWRNPHTALFIVGKDQAGKEVTYALEMGSPNTLVKFGYTRDTIKPGDAVVVEMHPSFGTPTNGYAPSSLRMIVNGKELQRSGRGENP